MTAKTRLRLLLCIPAIALIFVFMVLPITNMVEMSFRTPGTTDPFGDDYTLMHYTRILGDGYYWSVLARSLLTAALVTVLCLCVSFPIAWHLSRARGLKAVLLYAAIVSPLMTGVLVRNFGWMIVTALNGPLNETLMALGIIERPLRLLFTQGLVVLALVHVFVPFMVLPINNALRNIPESLGEASASMGASRMQVFRDVILPLSFPGIQPGMILVYVLAVAAYVTPALLGGQMVSVMPTLIIGELTGTFQWPFGSALAITLSISTVIVVVTFTMLTWKLMERAKA
ncbi:ABC transporter permease [Paracoccus laeviglucosivorans]|uniref:Putative spermidine/putrescine transport system permease protein n=1 Tax=Paracoccus laeviglucosivorans TaxID=1197861 RepID=A0A521FQI6_9RHOB|nr:ABC transporter permease [Paracoccus laeviglucosivorans]SMO97731.1 putative spermidine/putrescine transport system permease protein [Paracoccus laeviglucosivorans]